VAKPPAAAIPVAKNDASGFSPRRGGPRRAYKVRPAGSLEEATQALIDACGGRQAVLRLPGCYWSGAMMDKWTGDDPENVNKSIPAKAAAYLESVCGKPLVSAWIAAQSGTAVVPLSDMDAMALPEMAARMGKEESDVFARLGAALADGKITVDERLRLIGELWDVVDVAMAAVTGLQAEIDREVGR